MPATPAGRQAALRHAADRVETALAGLERPLSQYLLELEPERAEGRSWYAGPGAAELVEWRPVLDRAGVRACPNRVAAVYLELAVLVRALEGLARRRASTRRPIARRCGPASSTCRTRSSGRRWTTCARSPLDAAIVVVGSINLDLVAAASGSRVQARPSPARRSRATRAVRERTRRSPVLARSRGDDDRRGRPRSARRGGARGLREAGVALELRGRTSRRDRRDPRRPSRGEPDRRRSGRTRSRRRRASRADAVLCQLEIPDTAVESAWEACDGVYCLNAAPARPVAVDPDLTVVNRYEREELRARTDSSR